MGQEIEAKFFVMRPAELRKRLEALGADLIGPRHYECNLRFDTANGDLRKSGRVLRLRQDARVRLTYKDSDSFEAGAMKRRELEFGVDDVETAQEFLEALGFQVALMYEKYRTTYRQHDVEIMLDEMPYGHFVEIEGGVTALRPAAQTLNLNWEASIPSSYSSLFERVRERLQLHFRDLTFENFKDIHVSSADLGVIAADL